MCATAGAQLLFTRRLLAARRVCKPRWSACKFGACSAATLLARNQGGLSIVSANFGPTLAAIEAFLRCQKAEQMGDDLASKAVGPRGTG